MINVKSRGYLLVIETMRKNKKGQEEMVGFALIIIIVAVILVVLLAIALRKPKTSIESFEVESFIQTFLPYTTDCEDNLGFVILQDLIFKCVDNEDCKDGRDSCEVLEITIDEIAEAGWGLSDISGYNLTIESNEGILASVFSGNKTLDYKGAMENYTKISGDYAIISFTAYYNKEEN